MAVLDNYPLGFPQLHQNNEFKIKQIY